MFDTLVVSVVAEGPKLTPLVSVQTSTPATESVQSPEGVCGVAMLPADPIQTLPLTSGRPLAKFDCSERVLTMRFIESPFGVSGANQEQGEREFCACATARCERHCGQQENGNLAFAH
jgi:hypothetical protein